MKPTQSLSNISDKLRGTARETEAHLRSAAEAANEGLRETATLAADSARQVKDEASAFAGAAASEAAAAGEQAYKQLRARTGDAISSLDGFVAKNPVGAVVAALGMGLVLGMLARR